MKRLLCPICIIFAVVLATADVFAAPPAHETRARADFEAMKENPIELNSGIALNTNAKVIRDVSASDKRAISQAASRLLVHVMRARESIKAGGRKHRNSCATLGPRLTNTGVGRAARVRTT